MDEERMLVLMMEALDGELSGADSAEFGAHLQGNPDLAQEWRAMLAVDTLFRLTPSLAPPANLAARTLARLPNTAHRRWLTGGLFVALFLLGLAPVVAFFWFSGQSGAGSLVEVVAASAGEAVTLIQALLRVAFAAWADMLREQPIALGWLAAMLGIIATWSTLYRQLTGATVGLPTTRSVARSRE